MTSPAVNRKRQGTALRRARGYGSTGNLLHCEIWLKRAAEYWPLSDLQWHNLRSVVNDVFVLKVRGQLESEKGK